MKLTNIQIHDYKSIADVTVEVDPRVTILVGSNAVGKSNFVDAMRFMRDAAKGSLEYAIVRRDGMARIRPHGAGNLSETRLVAAYGPPSEASGSKNYFEIKTTGSLGDRALAFTDATPGSDVWNDVKSWKFSAPEVPTLRKLSALDIEAHLLDDGSNWASVVRAARRTAKGKQILDRINEMMRVMLPDFQEVVVTTAGSYLVPNFKFGDDKGTVRSFDPVELSDGTLRIYGILLALYQSPVPPLLVIEEPEQTVHPGVLAMLAEAIHEVSETTQIVVTTHSPQLVEHFAPETIRIVTMVDGVTHVAPIKKTQQEAVSRGLMGLGEFMAAEGLQPESP